MENIFKLLRNVKKAKEGIIGDTGKGYKIVPDEIYKDFIGRWREKPIEILYRKKDAIIYRNELYIKKGEKKEWLK